MWLSASKNGRVVFSTFERQQCQRKDILHFRRSTQQTTFAPYSSVGSTSLLKLNNESDCSTSYTSMRRYGSPRNNLRGSILYSNGRFSNNNNAHHLQQRRSISWLPEAMQSISIWGGSGYVIKALHTNYHLPYWACFAAISVMVRTVLFPLVIYGAHSASRFAKIVPEVQFLVKTYSEDAKRFKARGATRKEKRELAITAFATVGALYKGHKVNPLSVFLSPICQIPFFMYISTDLRKICNGLDPLLAQQLVDAPIAWIPDLTACDPWFGLPVLAGAAMYWNVEVSVGKRSLAGSASSKAETAVYMKDLFQSVAIFMPCFTSNFPAGIQFYVLTSFFFTMGQSVLLRTESFRYAVGLPAMSTPPPEPKFAMNFVRLKQLEQKAREVRGDGPIIGQHGLMAMGHQLTFPGEKRSTKIIGSDISNVAIQESPLGMKDDKDIDDWMPAQLANMPYIPGVSAPAWQIREQRHLWDDGSSAKSVDVEMMSQSMAQQEREVMPDITDEMVEKANRGEYPRKTQFIDLSKDDDEKPDVKLSTKRFKKSGKGKRKRK